MRDATASAKQTWRSSAPLGYLAANYQAADGEIDSAAFLGFEPGSIGEPKVTKGRMLTANDQDGLLVDVPAFMRSGMTANLTFRVAEKENALILPVSAVKGVGDAARVLIPAAGGAAEERAVRTGLSDGKRVEIVEGLAEGDRVLVASGAAVSTTAKESKSNPVSPMPRRPGRNTR